MSTLELKKLLISKIDDIDDVELLKAVYKLLDYKSTSGDVYVLSKDEEKEINEGLQQVREGKTISDEDVQKEIDRWLSE
ncbi:MAG: hypothetical protein ISS16_09545 [Ignavibacteria bacterium]|nr:hypothetical protein [Ignavibacteria bacterium]